MESHAPLPTSEPVLHSLVFHALEQQIAVLGPRGVIVDVNRAWCDFGRANGLAGEQAWVGRNYLAVLSRSAKSGDVGASEALNGIQDVFEGRRLRFCMEYPCHSPGEQRWFMMDVLSTEPALAGHCLVVHTNITARRLAELQAQHLAQHDPLTGLSNRRGFEPAFRLALRRSAREQRPLAVLAVDVDHFKAYNDRHGHPAGDACLAKIGALLRSFCRRPDDLAARLGGDEFVVVLDDCPNDRALAMAHDLRQAAGRVTRESGSPEGVSLSVGLLVLEPGGEPSFSEVLSAVDRALYEAKESGRNTVVALADPARAPSNAMAH